MAIDPAERLLLLARCQATRAAARLSRTQRFHAKPRLGGGLEPFVDRRAGKAVGGNDRGGGFGFLGFDFRYLRSLRGAWRPHYTPKLKKRTAWMRELKAVFRRYRSQPIEQVISLINPVLRGWVSYCAVGHSGKCFNIIKGWVEKKVRGHLARAQKRKGFGWEQRSRQYLYGTLKLFNGYRVQYGRPPVAPVQLWSLKSTLRSRPW